MYINLFKGIVKMKDKRIIQVALNNYLTNLEGKIDLESLHNTKRAKEALEDLDKSVSSFTMHRPDIIFAYCERGALVAI